MTEFRYLGSDNLDIVALLEHYNGKILDWVRAGVAPGQRVLDFGAGKGHFCNRMDGYDVSAVEPDRTFHARIACPAHATLAAAGGDFDLVYSLNVLEHIDDDAAGARGFWECLKPGGRVRVFVPALPLLYTAMDERVGHVRRYRRGELIRLFERAGFVVDDCRYFDFLGFFATLAYRVAGGSGTPSRLSATVYDRFAFPVSFLLDRLSGGRITGKNLIISAHKPEVPA